MNPNGNFDAQMRGDCSTYSVACTNGYLDAEAFRAGFKAMIGLRVVALTEKHERQLREGQERTWKLGW